MPVVSVFFGIVIRIFYYEHGVAYFHGDYQGQQATFTFPTGMDLGTSRSRRCAGGSTAGR